MKLVYISGPYRGKNEYEIVQHVRKAEEAALMVWANGGVAFCPHKNIASMNGAPGIPDATWKRGFFEILKRFDAIYLIENWMQSEGAREEYKFALTHGIQIFQNPVDLVVWLRDDVCENYPANLVIENIEAVWEANANTMYKVRVDILINGEKDVVEVPISIAEMEDIANGKTSTTELIKLKITNKEK